MQLKFAQFAMKFTVYNKLCSEKKRFV